jgi:hypothetical protein
MVNVVSIDPNSDGDVYNQKTGGVSLTKIACLKLMTAANVIMEESKTTLPLACQRCVEVARMTKASPQCGSCPTKEDVAYQVSILVPEPSGGYRRYIATKEVSKQQFIEKNGGLGKAPVEHMAAQCETKALLRALRAGLGIKGKYTKAELAKPFAVALVVLNTTDPDLKAALIQRYSAGADALFGATAGVPQLQSGELKALPGGRTVDTETGEIISSTETVTDDDDDPPSLGDTPAFGNDDQPAFDDEPVHICQDCGEPVKLWIDRKQKEWSVEDTVAFTRENLKGVFCHNCAGARMREMSKQKGA